MEKCNNILKNASEHILTKKKKKNNHRIKFSLDLRAFSNSHVMQSLPSPACLLQ